MHARLNPATALLLTLPPLLWAGNAVVGRIVAPLVPAAMLNLLRWTIAFAVLLPLAGWVLRRGSPLWPRWRRFALLGLLGVGCYNSLQYLALHTSTPLNATLVGSSMPVWMLLIGRLFFQAPVTRRAAAGALLSVAGVLVVLAHGNWQQLLALRLVPGDVLMVLATIAWGFYSWMLVQPGDPAALRSDWAAFLLAQMAFGLMWSAAFAAGEWALLDAPAVQWGWPLAAALAFIALGPALLAYRCWGAGVQRAGPAMASFFGNLTPLFAAILSAALLGEAPRAYHAVAFAFIVAGIAVSARRT